MAFTSSDIEALEDAIKASVADGTWRVQTHTFDDQAVTFHSLKEATDLLAWMRTNVVDSSTPRTRYAAHNKGLC